METPRPSWRDRVAEAVADAMPSDRPPTREETVAAVLAALPKDVPAAYAFSADSEFLDSVMTHHVSRYFLQVLAPLAKTQHSRKRTGRLIRDEEVETSALEVTTQIFREIGEGYSSLMSKYFGDREGMVAYTFNRVRDALLEAAMKHNEGFLRDSVRRSIADAINQEAE
jgi:hypothetical protein